MHRKGQLLGDWFDIMMLLLFGVFVMFVFNSQIGDVTADKDKDAISQAGRVRKVSNFLLQERTIFEQGGTIETDKLDSRIKEIKRTGRLLGVDDDFFWYLRELLKVELALVP